MLGSTVLHLYFAAFAMFGFALMVTYAAIQTIRGIEPSRFPLAVIAMIYFAFGVILFTRSHNPHHLGTLAMGVLLAAALAVPNTRR